MSEARDEVGPVYDAVERILDDESAWIARPSKTVTMRIALAATLHAIDRVKFENAERLLTVERALEESVTLQSHYAWLLNSYDGGKRIQFACAQEWLDRLAALSPTLPTPGDAS